MALRTLAAAQKLLDDAKRARSVDLHPHARQHQIPIKDIETCLAIGVLDYGATPTGEPERYTLDHRFGNGKRLRLVLTLDETPAYCLIISAYEKW